MENNKASIKKNFAYQMIYEVLIIILPFITSPYIARVIGADGLGVYSFSYSVAYYFVLFSMLGLKNYGNRAIAKARNAPDEMNRVFSSIVVVHICISFICTLAYAIYAVTRNNEKEYALIQFFFVVSGIFDISWFYFGIEKFKLTVTRNTIIKIVNIICVFTFVRSRDDLGIYCLIMSLGSLISQICLWLPLRRYVKFVIPKKKEMLVHIKPLIILFIPAIAVSLYKYMDKIMIGSMSNKGQLGYYENAEKVVNIPLTIIVSFGTVMLPKMSNLASKKNKEESQRYINLSMQFIMCLAFALTFGLAGVGKVFAPIFWGNEFNLSGSIIMGLAITIPFISFADVLRTQYLIPNERDREYLVSVICGACINLVINYVLIPRIGAIGAMIGTIIAEITVCFIQAFSVRKDLPVIDYIKQILFFILIGALMFVTVYLIGCTFGKHIWVLLVQIGVGGGLYGILAFAYFYKKKNPVFMNLLTKITRKNNNVL